MKEITLQISGLHSEAPSTHLIILLNNYVNDKKEGDILEANMIILKNLDQIYQKLKYY